MVCLSAISMTFVGSVYIGGYGGLRESGLYVFLKLCAIGFLVVGNWSSVLLHSIVMSYVDCGNDGYWSNLVAVTDWVGANSRFLGLVSVGAARSLAQTALRPSVIKIIRQMMLNT